MATGPLIHAIAGVSGDGVIRWWLRGAVLGFAMVVPGLSTGTVALVGGFYGSLVRLLCTPSLMLLGPLLAGAVGGLVLGGRLMVEALAVAPRHIAFALVGIVTASALSIAVEQRQGPRTTPWLMAGVVGGWLLSGLGLESAAEVPVRLTLVATGGMVGGATMVMPGISGASMLVVMGQYHIVLQALAAWELRVLVVLVLGGLVGLMVAGRAAAWALDHHPGATLLLLSGLMLGSIRSLWPGAADPAALGLILTGAAAVMLLKRSAGHGSAQD